MLYSPRHPAHRHSFPTRRSSDLHRLEILPCLPEVRRAVRAEELGERRCAVEHRSALSLLAIEHPQGIALDPLPALFTEAVGVRAQIADELRPIARPTLGVLVAERVDLDLQLRRKIEPLEELDEHRDHLRIERRVLVAERLHVEL